MTLMANQPERKYRWTTEDELSFLFGGEARYQAPSHVAPLYPGLVNVPLDRINNNRFAVGMPPLEKKAQVIDLYLKQLEGRVFDGDCVDKSVVKSRLEGWLNSPRVQRNAARKGSILGA